MTGSKISPTVILILVILAVIIFVYGILHLLIRFLVKKPSFHTSFSQPSRISDSNGRNNSNSDVIQRQLQQLFRLHDSGLDQPLIDALPVFYYKDIMGLKEPFDCAVCLCKFNDEDKLRLLPLCSHAFHVGCIDTWLLSNSTCPLCRGSLLSHGLENQEFSLDYWRELSFGRSICSDYDHINNGNSFNCGSSYKPTIMEENASERRVFSVRLGKFKSVNDGNELCKNRENCYSDHGNNGQSFNYSHKPTIMEENASERRVFSVRLGKFKCLNDENDLSKNHETSENSVIASTSSQLDARRCLSLGSYQYVLDDSEFQVALSAEIGASSSNISDLMLEKTTGTDGNVSVDGDVEGKKISRRNRGDSFSVSKIWLWSKKGKFQGSSNTIINNNGGNLPINVVLPLSTRDVDES